MPAPESSPAHARRKPSSKEMVLRLVSHHGSVTRAQLMDLSGLPRTTVYDAVAALVDSGAITTALRDEDGRGAAAPSSGSPSTPDAASSSASSSPGAAPGWPWPTTPAS